MKLPLSLLFLALALAPMTARAHESPIDHVERELRLWVKDGRLWLSYRLIPTERATLMELKQMDTNGNGKVANEERDAFFAEKAKTIAGLFALKIDNQSLVFKPAGNVKRDAQLGQTFLFEAELPDLKPGRHAGLLVDGHSREYPGAFRWKEPGRGGAGDIRVEPITQGTNPRSAEHPPWLELQFAVVVP